MAHQQQGYAFRGFVRSANGSRRTIDDSELVRLIKGDDDLIVATIHAEDLAKTADYLENELELDTLAVEDALSRTERPTMTEYETYLFLVAVSIAHHDGDEKFAEIAVFMGSNYLIAITYDKAPALDQWYRRQEASKIPVGNSIAFTLHSLLDTIVDGYFPVCDDIEETVDGLEDRVFDGDDNIVPEALRLKRRLLELRQKITPIRDVINGLLRRDINFIPKEVMPFFQDVYDHTLRVAEIVDVNRDIIAGVLDAHLAQVSNSLNISMRVLTVMATFLMTGSLIAGIYGMNFKYMPELNQTWGYPFSIVTMVVLGVAEWVYFKRKGWF